MKKVIGYVSTKDLGTLKEQDIKNLDVINIAFGLIERHRVVWDSCGNEEYLPKIREINPDIKIILSVGGWGADGFSQAARTEEGRALFAVSAVSLVETYGLDGIDIDWEYPGTSLAGIGSHVNDKENYTLLLTFADGKKRLYNARPLLNKPLFADLKSLPFFLQARVGGDTVVWNDEVDIAPEHLYENSVPIP